MLALSIRQPYAELILRGIKTVEYRSRRTNVIGERFFIYASRGRSQKPGAGSGSGIWSKDLSEKNTPPPLWMIELAEQVGMIEPGTLLPTGVIVGSAVIERVEKVDSGEWIVDGDRREGRSPLSTNDYRPSTLFKWHLVDVRRAWRLRKPTRHPQPVWFRPF
jgi:ASCH domain-containing protein